MNLSNSAKAAPTTLAEWFVQPQLRCQPPTVAEKLGIAYHGIDWQAALEACQPDIVSIATPGGAHYKPIKQASISAVISTVKNR